MSKCASVKAASPVQPAEPTLRPGSGSAGARGPNADARSAAAVMASVPSMRCGSERVPGRIMDDTQIAAEIQRRGLEIEYLRELASALGYADEEGWTEEVFAAVEGATPQQRRQAALRTLELTED
jgi:hypothetical protein